MFKDCKMVVETLASASGAGYRLAIEGSQTLCLDPTSTESETAHAATLVVTNDGPSPLTINHRDGPIAGFSFRADKIFDALDPREAIDFHTGPLSADMVKHTSATIAPGAEYRFRGDPRYMIQIGSLAKRGAMIDGSLAAPDQYFDRTFRISFYVFFDLTRDGVKTEVSETLPAVLRVVVRDVANE
jgi:hypothetical protein